MGGHLHTTGFDKIPPATPLPPIDARALDTLDESPEAALEHLRSELDFEILEIRRVLRVGGHAVWRSAAKYPWYRQRFELAGFRVEPIDIRENGNAIDRVNMYASCECVVWRGGDEAVTNPQSGVPRRWRRVCVPTQLCWHSTTSWCIPDTLSHTRSYHMHIVPWLAGLVLTDALAARSSR